MYINISFLINKRNSSGINHTHIHCTFKWSYSGQVQLSLCATVSGEFITNIQYSTYAASKYCHKRHNKIAAYNFISLLDQNPYHQQVPRWPTHKNFYENSRTHNCLSNPDNRKKGQTGINSLPHSHG